MNSKIESGVHLFSRIKQKMYLEGINPLLFPEDSLQQNSVIEITGSDANEKYKLLMDFMIRCILPPSYNKEFRDCGVIFINVDHQIQLMDLIKIMNMHLKKLNIKSKSQIIENALKNLTIVNCFNLEEFQLAIQNIERIVNSNENQSLVLIDNISPYYWSQRFFVNNLSLYSWSLKNFEMLYDVVKSLNIAVIFIRNETTENKKQLCKFVDLRIIVQREGEYCKALVLNYVKQSEICVSYKSENILIF
ncbi:unnamed protein product [Brassicogethes aeneus]|uniref:DNA recombination and repair protein Rad51-like C-terminal domain-containing protein n=1 Tax=Brassicogethes aeneus TaxID=1431903 RepID=A0A9P0B3R4_BRAAE|nr:unnamed protein product [Brassicogethes aeneus]